MGVGLGINNRKTKINWLLGASPRRCWERVDGIQHINNLQCGWEAVIVCQIVIVRLAVNR